MLLAKERCDNVKGYVLLLGFELLELRGRSKSFNEVLDVRRLGCVSSSKRSASKTELDALLSVSSATSSAMVGNGAATLSRERFIVDISKFSSAGAW